MASFTLCVYVTRLVKILQPNISGSVGFNVCFYPDNRSDVYKIAFNLQKESKTDARSVAKESVMVVSMLAADSVVMTGDG